jgi:hypothetical protein
MPAGSRLSYDSSGEEERLTCRAAAIPQQSIHTANSTGTTQREPKKRVTAPSMCALLDSLCRQMTTMARMEVIKEHRLKAQVVLGMRSWPVSVGFHL